MQAYMLSSIQGGLWSGLVCLQTSFRIQNHQGKIYKNSLFRGGGYVVNQSQQSVTVGDQALYRAATARPVSMLSMRLPPSV